MSHHIAKLLLDHAQTAPARVEAIQRAMELGMPIHEIEEYLDWLDSIRNNGEIQATDPKSQA